MKSLDARERQKNEIKNKMMNALKENNEEQYVAAQTELAEMIQNELIRDAKATISADLTNENIMLARGLNPLTSEEKKYYNEVIEAEGFENIDAVMPKTVFERVFEDLRKDRPLLNLINFQNTTAITEWITRDRDVDNAWWGKLCEPIKKKLETGFQVEDMRLYKLSAYIPVCKAMLDLGPAWLDRYVREMLYESLAGALEEAIVAGDGDSKPIGMMKDLKGAVVEGKYPDKGAVKLPSFKARDLGEHIMAPLTKDGTRVVNDVILIINPVDYWSKVFGTLAVRNALGEYILDQTAIGAKIVQSVAVPKGKMIAGLTKDYFMGVGSSQTLDYSDHYQFLEDTRVYIAKQYANGRPKDNDSFLLFDISDIGETPVEG
ncbi:phage major capsid protein [Anaerosalibacter massiliensis]|uniref:phage major capsid protein n=1 Tax=Anaerosalibacter massiliensis TaxID=1347392 RepID=UPI000AB7048D|nr:phage major capsid protein [Anaerosalibacter massiliensis]